VIVIFGGEVVAELPAAEADEAALLRAAHNLRSDAPLPEQAAAETTGAGAAVQAAVDEETAAVNKP